MRSLRLDLLSSGRIPGISIGGGAALAEAAAQCLTRAGFASRAPFELRGDISAEEIEIEIEFEPPSLAVERFWADERKAIEFGAEAVAALLVEELTSWTIARRSRIGTGFDHWLVPKGGMAGDLYQESAKLEVSGIFEAADSRLGARVRAKLQQARRTRSDLVLVAMVVRFRPPTAEVRIEWI
ncbi:MAG: hypothetical protein GC160_13140 [Acidobacteria bacterium]|nr:hypothetical protein [Acidobacteriota bacterium]